MNEQECARVCKSLQEYAKSIQEYTQYARVCKRIQENMLSFRALIFLEGERCNEAVSRRMHKENATVDKSMQENPKLNEGIQEHMLMLLDVY